MKHFSPKTTCHRPAAEDTQTRILAFLYDTLPGRILLKPLVCPWFSNLGGRFLDTRLSALLIPSFVKRNQIDLSLCTRQTFSSYNDFFSRTLKPDARPFSKDPRTLISPCDARLSVYPIASDRTFSIKKTPYTLTQLLQDPALAGHYEGGLLFLFRLCVDDYHRYCYPVSGRQSKLRRIPGIFHTVNPIANDHVPVYKQNTREYCLLCPDHQQPLIMMEVGALLVGRIENHSSHPCRIVRGEEKGTFAFGGSTIVIITARNSAAALPQFMTNTKEGIETKVKQGETVGYFSDRCLKK